MRRKKTTNKRIHGYAYDNFVLHCIGRDMSVAGNTAVQLFIKMRDAAGMYILPK